MISGSSDLAQGGIAAAIGKDDRATSHAADTIAVGGGLVDEAVAQLVAEDAPNRIAWLQKIGAKFDQNLSGDLDLGREAGHSTHRIVHTGGDATGRAVMQALRSAVANHPGITVLENTEVIDLVRSGKRVVGVITLTPSTGEVVLLTPAVVLATGGIGRVYVKTTNPPTVTGDGLVIAARAGAALRDLEFVQFHPTALDAKTDPLPLLTEALRGAGATLLDGEGQRFMAKIHPHAELAPRDVVARAVGQAAENGGAYLDVTPIAGELTSKFPTLVATAASVGIDPFSDPLPVTPAAHYYMGGIVTDIDGKTSLRGLYACGEVATTGLHGSNRLASNSLLEGLVFADRVASSIRKSSYDKVPRRAEIPVEQPISTAEPSPEVRMLRKAMWEHAGIERDEIGLSDLLTLINTLAPSLSETIEGRNLATASLLIADAARKRTESRGSHFRSDYPHRGASRRFTIRPVPVATQTVSTSQTFKMHVS